jgi:hypothetical protein
VEFRAVFWSSAVNDFMRLMASGDPPLGLQFLVVNTVFLIVAILRRLRARRPWRTSSSHISQALLIAINMLVAMQDTSRPLFNGLPL